MDDDIDIEEHDVLDNPRLRTIFPDISQIKTEAPDYDSTDVEEQPGFSSQICFEDNPLEDNQYEYFSDEDDAMDYDETPAVSPRDVYNSNKIIIGTKPNLKTEVVLPETNLYIEALNSNTQVRLEDWGSILSASQCFCKDCGTLFATVNALDGHKMLAHSFLVEVDGDRTVRRNYAKKSTVPNKTVDSKPCFHCNKVYANFDELTKHLIEVIQQNDKNKVLVDEETSKDEGVADVAHKCPSCGVLYREEKSILNHIKINHGSLETDVSKYIVYSQYSASSFNCQYCQKITKNVKYYNAHIRNYHAEHFLKKYNYNTEKLWYKCTECKNLFDNYGAARTHRIAAHPEMYNKAIFKRVTRKTTQAVPKAIENPKPVKITKDKVKVKKTTVARRQLDVSIYNQSRTVELHNTPVPKSVLFRCKKCNVHFISASLTMRHIPKCRTGPNKTDKCTRCNRVVRFQDRHIHDHQHKVSDKIEIYDINIRVLERTLCKCPSCDTCYDDRDFWTHFDQCGDSNPRYCDHCDLLIADTNFNAHKFKHESNINDFIVIDFVLLDGEKTKVIHKKIKTNLNSEKRVEVTAIETAIEKPNILCNKTQSNVKSKYKYVKKPKMTLRYCHLCECSFGSLKHDKVYPSCKNIKKQVCPHCGLYFTVSLFKRHKMLHQIKHITLHDFKFIKFSNSTQVIPKAPEYPQCKKCKVYFVDKSEITMHNCQTYISKVCVQCNKKFGPLAFKLHSQFHLYGKVPRVKDNEIKKDCMPVLMQKYESLKKMWNILYMCADCAILSDNYDRAIEHSQNHINDIVDQNNPVKTCIECDLRFDPQGYLKHKKLHNTSNQQINRKSFKIFKYNYRHLLGSNWLKLFGDLPNENIKCILSRSMYRATNYVRMKLLRVGQGSSFYQCATCKNYIDENSVYDHAHNQKCSIEDQDEKPTHVGKHSRIISFNHENDEVFNKRLIGHETEMVEPKMTQNNEVKEYKTFNNYRKLYDIYQCSYCDATILCKPNLKRHNCMKHRNGPKGIKKWKCGKCGQFYTSASRQKHEKFHKIRPNFSKDTVNVIMFKPEGKPKKLKRKVKLPSKMAAKIKDKVLKPAVPKSTPVYRVYRCTLCGLHFTSMLTIAKHFDICHRQSVPSSECNRCHRLFSTDCLVNHLLNHHVANHNEIIVEDVEPRMKEVKLYECARCSLLFPRKDDAIGHRDCGVNNGQKCTDCNLIFHTDSFKAHECTEYIENDIITVNKEEDNIEDDTQNISDAQRDVICKQMKMIAYKCEMCNVHFNYLEAWYRHIEVDHELKFPKVDCELCHLTYSSTKSLASHLKMHHKGKKTDFRVRIMDAKAIKDMKAISNNARIEFVVNEAFDETVGESYGVTKKIYLQMLRTNYDNTLYKCNQCSQHFVTRSTWDRHIFFPSGHDGSVYKCPECSYTFAEQSLARHRYLHHHLMKLTRDKIDVVHFNDDSVAIDTIMNRSTNLVVADSIDDLDKSVSPPKKSKCSVDLSDDENFVSSSTKDFT